MGFVRGLLFDNLGLKFVALLLAILIYVNVYTDREQTITVSFPLRLTELNDSLSLSGPVPAAIQAELRGTGKQLIRLRLKEPMLDLSLANVGPGRYERSLSASDLPLGGEAGPRLERLIGPLMVSVSVERRVERRVPVAPRLEGQPGEGYRRAGAARVDPPAVLVNGPASAVAALDSLRLQVVSVDGARDTLRVQAQPDGLPLWCEAVPSRVTVVVPVARGGS
jgi:YbbR domain-containing protein